MKELKISRNSIVGRWYQHWRSLGGMRPYGVRVDGRENLCHFMRVLFVWAPLRFLGCQKLLGAVLPIWVGLGVWLGLLLSFPLVREVSLYTVAVLGGACLFVATGIYCQEKYEERKYTRRKLERQPSLIIEYLKAKKAKICPFVSLED